MGLSRIRLNSNHRRLHAAAAMLLICLAVLGARFGPGAGALAQAEDPYPAPPESEFPVFSGDSASDAYSPPDGSSINVGGPADWADDVFVDPMMPDEIATPIEPVVVNPNGLLFLWLGFLVALLVFGTSVIGSVLLFARRNEL